MKRTLLTLLISGLATCSFGQKAFILAHQTKKGFLALSAGSSLPVGQFACKAPNNHQAGMARNGIALSISAGYQLAGPMGLMIRGEQHRNGIKQVLPDGPGSIDRWSSNNGNWAVTTLMGGPYISIPLGRFTLNGRLLAGQAWAVSPASNLNGTNLIDVSMKTTGSPAMALAMGGGLSAHYRLGRCLSLHLNGDYTRAQLLFATDPARSHNNWQADAGFSSPQTVSVVSVSAGIALLFGNSTRPF